MLEQLQQWIREEMAARRLTTLDEVAWQAGVSRPTISRIMAGRDARGGHIIHQRRRAGRWQYGWVARWPRCVTQPNAPLLSRSSSRARKRYCSVACWRCSTRCRRSSRRRWRALRS